jgi:hypothetical protein
MIKAEMMCQEETYSVVSYPRDVLEWIPLFLQRIKVAFPKMLANDISHKSHPFPPDFARHMNTITAKRMKFG